MNVPLPSTLSQRAAEAAQSRLAQRLAAALTEYQSRSARSDIDARLAFAHDRAMDAARRTRAATATATAVAPSLSGAAGGAAILGGLPGSDSTPWWLRLGSLVPLVVLLAGLVLIDNQYTRSQIEAAAEVDAAILADDLPPEAYRDQGFVEFLRSARP
jgi:hypothetical protein